MSIAKPSHLEVEKLVRNLSKAVKKKIMLEMVKTVLILKKIVLEILVAVLKMLKIGLELLKKLRSY